MAAVKGKNAVLITGTRFERGWSLDILVGVTQVLLWLSRQARQQTQTVQPYICSRARVNETTYQSAEADSK
jgi:hypothetical protein